MNPSNFRAAIATSRINKTFTCRGKPVLTLSITYPKVTLRSNPAVQRCINRHIQAQVDDFCRYAAELAEQAAQAAQDAQKNGFPFFPYEAVLQYRVAYNLNCHLSLYRDQYTFTGGAHGNTIRASDTWSLVCGERLPLSAFFPAGQDYRALLLGQITAQADRQMQQEPGIYFDDYRTLIEQNFNEESYYLTPAGLAVYYQQYEIAPYATGIVVFTIPYETLGFCPSCAAPSCGCCP